PLGKRARSPLPKTADPALDPSARHGVPVGLVEDDLAQVPEAIRLGRLGRMVVVELEQRALAVADLEEAHHLAGVAGVLPARLAALHRCRDPLGDDRRLEMSGRARL